MSFEDIIWKATAKGKDTAPIQTGATKETLEKMRILGPWMVKKGYIDKDRPYSVAKYCIQMAVEALYEIAKEELHLARS